MLKILSDPRVYPLRQIDLSGVADGLAAVVALSDTGNRNLSFERPDGGRNVIFRNRRPSFTVDLTLLPYDAARDLVELAGISRANRERVFLMLAPNLDRSTLISAPLSRSTKAWRKNVTTGVFDVVSPSTQTIEGSRYQIDEGGRLEVVGAGVPRFEEAVIGRGIRIERAFGNLCNPSHPASGSPLWTAGTGAPVVAFDGSLESVARDKVGATRVTQTSTAAAEWNFAAAITGASRIGFAYCGQWLKGDCQVQTWIQEGAAGFVGSTAVSLRQDQWTFVTHRIQTAAASSSFSVKNSIVPDGRVHEVYQGPIVFYQTPNLLLVSNGIQQWTEATSAKNEIVELGPFRAPREFSISLLSTVPLRTDVSSAILVNFAGGTGNSDIYWAANGLIFRIEGVESNPVQISGLDFFSTRGRPLLFLSRMDPRSGQWKNRLSVLRADRSILRIDSTTPITSNPPNWEDVTTARIGGKLGDSGTHAVDAKIEAFRIDARAYSDQEADLFELWSLEDEFRNLRLLTEGKLFELVDAPFAALDGRWRDASGSITLEEVDSVSSGELSHAV